MAGIGKIYSDATIRIEKNTEQKLLDDFIPKSAAPMENCYVLG